MAPSVRPLPAVLLTVAATAAVALVRLALSPVLGHDLPLLGFSLAVLFAAWLGGVRLGLFATALGWLVGEYLFFEPRFSFWPLGFEDEVRLAIYLLGNGTLSWLVGTLREAQRRTAAEHEWLAKSQAFHAAIAEISTDFAFAARVEPDGTIVPESVSEGFGKLLGFSLSDAGPLGDARALFHRDDVAQVERDVARALAGHTVSGEARAIARDGRVVWLAYCNRAQRDASGRVVRIYGAARDITREKEAEAARAAAVAEAEARAEALRENTERLEEALSVGRMIAWENDLAKREVVLSENAPALVGVRSGSLEDLIHPEDRAEVRARLERAVKGDGYDESEFRVLGPGGATLWFTSRARLRRDASGRPTRLTGICVDITARKRAEQALRQRDEELRLAFDAAAMIGFQWDIRSGRVTRLGKVPPGDELEFTMQEVVDRIHPEDRPEWQAGIRGALADGTDVFTSEHRWHEDGRWRWLLVHARIERAGDGRPLAMTGLGIDVTPLKEMQEALREADRRKDEFIATLAHELRNPLAPLRNGLQVLQMEPDAAPTTRRVHEMMARQVDQMVRLVDDLLEVSRITRGQVELRKRPVALQTALDHAIETSRPLIEAGRHQLVLDVPEAPVWLDADPVRLAQVVSNLLNNAARYTPSGGRIELSARCEDGDVVVAVRDTGVGISADVLPRVFEMFVRGDRSQGGLGIGLALVRALVEMHGGSVEAHSAGIGCGSEFVVRLPIAARAGAGDAARAGRAPAEAASKLDVVAVDDNRDAADALAMLLGYMGAQVTVAYDGASALETIRAQRPRLALLDLGMPVLDGFELARRVRSDPELDGVTLVALSGWGQEQDRRRSRAAGFDRHLVKPVDRAALEELLASLG